MFPNGNQLSGVFTQREEREEEEAAEEGVVAEVKPPLAVHMTWKSGAATSVH